MHHKKQFVNTIVILILIGFLNINLSAAKKSTASLKASNATANPYLNVLKWRSIGPYRGGRVVAAAGHPMQKEVFYFGGTGSGVWKTKNGGETWKNISDGFFKTSSVGAIALSQSNPNVIYVGMGESCLRGNISHGDGVYKSTDNGKTWKHMGLSDSRQIARIRVHPSNSDIIYVAALGHAFGANAQRGVFRSLNGGKTWKKILYKNNNTGAIDLEMEPGNPRVLYAAFWEVQRFPWGFSSGGPGCGIHKSTDGGNSWKDITQNPGLPKGTLGRIGISVSPAKPERVWAIIEAKKSGLYLSDDSGETWKRISTDANLLQRPWYYSHVNAHPRDADTLFVSNVGFWKSTDKGKTFKQIRTPHGDHHDLWIDTDNPQRMIQGNDGGATVTFNGGRSWSSVENQPTAQFYHVTTDKRFPYRVYGAQQDNSTLSLPSRSPSGQITKNDWYHVGGCESGYIAVHPQNPDIVYAGCYGGSLSRYDHKLKRTQNISVWPENPMGWAAKDLKYRFQWTFPILFSPHDSNVLYAAGNHVFRSLSEGREWEVISPDLSRNDKSKMESSGGPLTKDNTSVEYYGTIFSLVESPKQKGLLWAGSDDGLIHITRDNGKTWQNVTPKQLPEWSLISVIEASRYDAAVLYVAATRYKMDDLKPYLYVTRDYGKTWRKISTGIPDNAFTRVIREDPNKKNFLYSGTETGIYYSSNSGKSWQPLQLNLPVTPIHDMVIRNNDLVVGTHGRSFWILDDLTLLYQSLQLASTGKDPQDQLFQPSVTTRYRGGYRTKRTNAGETLQPGVIVNYYLKQRPKDDLPVTLTFLDSNGKTIRSYTRKPEKKREAKVSVKAGLNRFVWDLSYPSARSVKGAVFWGPGNVSPRAIPGDYKVRLTLGKKLMEKPFKLVKDPNFPVTDKQFQQKFEFLLKLRDKLSQTHDAVNEIRSIRKQVKWVTSRTKKEKYFKKLEIAAKALEKKLTPIEDQLIQHKAKASQDLLNYPIRLNNKLTALGEWIVKNSWGAPTKQAKEVFQILSQRVDTQIKLLKEVIEKDVAEFNRLVQKESVPAIIPEHMKRNLSNI